MSLLKPWDRNAFKSREEMPVEFESWFIVGMPGMRFVESFLVKTVCFCIMNVLFDLGFFARSAKEESLRSKRSKRSKSQEPNFPDGLVLGAGLCCFASAYKGSRVCA